MPEMPNVVPLTISSSVVRTAVGLLVDLRNAKTQQKRCDDLLQRRRPAYWDRLKKKGDKAIDKRTLRLMKEGQAAQKKAEDAAARIKYLVGDCLDAVAAKSEIAKNIIEDAQKEGWLK